MKSNIPFIMAICVLVMGMIGLGITSCRAENKLEAVNVEMQEYIEEAQWYAGRLNDTYKQLVESQESFQIEKEKCTDLNAKINNLSTELEEKNKIIQEFKSDEYELIYIGDFKLTHYCIEKRNHICGTGTGLTATGTHVVSGRTIAVDPKVIPYGAEVYIEGYGWRVAEDCGGAVKGKHIDIAVGTHSQALSMGTTSGGVWLLVKRTS